MEDAELMIEGASSGEPAGITRKGIVMLIFAVCAVAAAYIFVSLVPIARAPIGFFAVTLGLYAATLIISLLLGAKPGVISFAAMAFGLCVAFFRIINGSVEHELFPVFIISGMAYTYFAASLFGNVSRRFDGRVLLDLVKSFVYLFVSFSAFFVSLFKPEGSKSSPKKIITIIASVLAALLLVLIVASLLSYDKHFFALLPKIDVSDVFEFLAKTILTVPIAAMIMSVLVSSLEKKLPKLSSKESCDKVGSKVKVIPALLVILPVIGVLVIYVLFLISQWAYFMSAFTGSLPADYSYAEYAREGFFQLCAVAVINSLLIVMLTAFTKRTSKASAVICRILTVALSLATLALIVIAVSKMALYIDKYDLTRDRLAVTAFLVFLAVSFVAVILSTLINKVKALPIIMTAAVVFTLAASFFNVNKFIADYNVDMYLSGMHKNIDMEYIADDLGWEAAPALDRIVKESDDSIIVGLAQTQLNKLANAMDEIPTKWYEKSIPYYKAKAVFESGKTAD